MKKRLKPLMLGGTGSDVGKSVLVAGLCRIFRQDGYNPAPFKAQNMALNSYVTPDGLEIGRAQAVQAEAAGVECCAEMNPVLLKPSGEMRSQVVVLGLPVGNRDARDYYRKGNKEALRKEANAAFDRLSERYSPIVMEGAGSIAELNLMNLDIVNMPMADYADASVILVADIDRGGVFASVYGSIMLQPEKFRNRIKGVVINKFRGDITLFEEGRKIIEDTCGIPVLGVVPYFKDINIEEEDSVALAVRSHEAGKPELINVAVAAFPQMSNYTDFDMLGRDPRVHLYFTLNPDEMEKADVILLPGSKNTLSDLAMLRESGCDKVIATAADRKVSVMGICGGYQMMGIEVADPDGVEGNPSVARGLGLLPVKTLLTKDKRLCRSRVSLAGGVGAEVCEGYEIHMGRTELLPGASPLLVKEDGTPEGCKVGEWACGCYIHGILDNKVIVNHLLRPHAERKGLLLDADVMPAKVYKEQQYNLLADRLRDCIDIDRIYKLMQDA